MKIGFLIYGSLDTISGGYLYDRKLVEYLRARGERVEIISLPWRNYFLHLMDNLTFKLPGDLDLLIQDELNHPSLIAANAGNHAYPVISLVHHLRSSEMRPKWQNVFYRVVEKMYLQGVDGFIFNSKTTGKVVTKLMEGRDMPSMVAHPPSDRFVDRVISEEEIRERAETEELRVLFLGNVIHRKGLHVLLRAVKNLKHLSSPAEDTQIRVDVVGGLTSEPRYADEMQGYVLTHDLSSAVRFYGAMDHESLVEMFRQAHLMVVPSSYEGFGVVYLEGMGFGLPAIGTSAGAAGEIITHEKNGYLIEPDDDMALAEIIGKLAIDRGLLVEISLNAVQRYKSQPRWEETARSIRDFLYRRIA